MILFHGSTIQYLRELNPSFNITTHDEILGRVYATSIREVAVAFSFRWCNVDGVRFGIIDEQLLLSIPKSFKEKLNNPCSIYILDSDSFLPTKNVFIGEYISKECQIVVREIQYQSVIEALDSNGVNYEII